MLKLLKLSALLLILSTSIAVDSSYARTPACAREVKRISSDLNRKTRDLDRLERQVASAELRVSSAQERKESSLARYRAQEAEAKAARDFFTGSCIVQVVFGLTCYQNYLGKKECATSYQDCANKAIQMTTTLARISAKVKSRAASEDRKIASRQKTVDRLAAKLAPLKPEIAALQKEYDSKAKACDITTAHEDCIYSKTRTCRSDAVSNCRGVKPYSTCIVAAKEACPAAVKLACSGV